MYIVLDVREWNGPPRFSAGPGAAFQRSHYIHDGVEIACTSKIEKSMSFLRKEFYSALTQDGCQYISLRTGGGCPQPRSCPHGIEIRDGPAQVVLLRPGLGTDQVLFCQANHGDHLQGHRISAACRIF